MPKPKFFLIDANALCYRSYFAIKNLSTSKGQLTNAVYGFVNTLRKILKEFNPEYLAVCFDASKKTLRQEKFAEYKIQRPPMPNDLVNQLPVIKKIVGAYNLPLFEKDGYEADDLIATLVKNGEAKGLDVVIVTDDKDMFQLLSENVKIYSARKGILLNEEDIRNQLGFDPKKITDFIGLAGDSADNIPGVKGVGEVTAKALIEEFGNLENIIEQAEQIKSSKVKEKILAQKETAVLSKDLAILDDHVPIDLDLKKIAVVDPDKEQLFEIFKELEFKTFAQEFAPQADIKETVVTEMASKGDLSEFVKDVRKNKIFSFLKKVEEDGAWSGVWVENKQKVFFIAKNDLKAIKDLFEDKDILKITYDLKEHLHAFAEIGLFIEKNSFDILLGGYLLSPAASYFDLKGLAWNFLKVTLGGPDAAAVGHLPALAEVVKKELQVRKLEKLYDEMELPLTYVLFEMEEAGVGLDLGLLRELSKECELKIQKITEQLFKICGEEFNLNSPKQLSHVLFEKLRLPVVKKTKTGFSTDEEVLTRLSANHEVPALILEYRQLAKIKSTYIDALPQLVNSKTNRIHARFHQTGAETGRLSSSDPNLQNIPIRTELGRQIRRAFVPLNKSHSIVSADYSQIELRVLAHLSGDETLKKAFIADQDVHSYTAALIFEVPEDKVNYEMRDTAKRVNFGIIYGMSSFGLSKDLKISPTQAQDFIDRYFLRYPKVKEFMDQEIEKCRKDGFVTTLFNRRRYIPEINSANQNVRQFAERQAINTPVQGTAADLIKLAMINIQKEIDQKKLESKMIITVHDELVFDSLKSEEKAVVAMIKDKMENVLKLSVPIKVGINIGSNWLDTKEIK